MSRCRKLLTYKKIRKQLVFKGNCVLGAFWMRLRPFWDAFEAFEVV